MENFLNYIKGIMLELRIHEITIVGKGSSSSSSEAQELINNTALITINDSTYYPGMLMSFATRKDFAREMALGLPEKVPILVSETLSLDERFVSIPSSDLDYLEAIAGNIDLCSPIKFREDFVLLTILQIVNQVSQDLGSRTFVNLTGFDFTAPNLSESDPFLAALLNRQRSIFKEIENERQRFSNLEIRNAGDRSNIMPMSSHPLSKEVPTFTDIEFRQALETNNHLLKSMLTEPQLLRPIIVAELTNNHLGETDRLVEMVKAAKAQGADIIKLQKRDPRVLYTKEELETHYESPFGSTLGDYRHGVELTVDQLKFITIVCAQLEIPWYASVLDDSSLNLMMEFAPVVIKLPSTISNHRNYLATVIDYNIEWFQISTGATGTEFLDWINNVFKSKNLILMQCTSSYPTANVDCNVRALRSFESHLPDINKLLLGYSSHDIGNLASQLAVATGAIFLEKHCKFGSVSWIHFDGVALDLEQGELKGFVDAITSAVEILGDGEKRVLSSEHHKYVPNDRHN